MKDKHHHRVRNGQSMKWNQEVCRSQYPATKIDAELKLVKRNKEGHFILIKGTVNEEDITALKIYVPNSGTPNSL